MQKPSRFAGLSVPFLAMWVSAFFGPVTIGFTVCCASLFLAGVVAICADHVVSQIKGFGTSSKPRD
jgi:hypothetical protein